MWIESDVLPHEIVDILESVQEDDSDEDLDGLAHSESDLNSEEECNNSGND